MFFEKTKDCWAFQCFVVIRRHLFTYDASVSLSVEPSLKDVFAALRSSHCKREDFSIPAIPEGGIAFNGLLAGVDVTLIPDHTPHSKKKWSRICYVFASFM